MLRSHKGTERKEVPLRSRERAEVKGGKSRRLFPRSSTENIVQRGIVNKGPRGRQCPQLMRTDLKEGEILISQVRVSKANSGCNPARNGCSRDIMFAFDRNEKPLTGRPVRLNSVEIIAEGPNRTESAVGVRLREVLGQAGDSERPRGNRRELRFGQEPSLTEKSNRTIRVESEVRTLLRKSMNLTPTLS